MSDGASPTTLAYIAITIIVLTLGLFILIRVSPTVRAWLRIEDEED